MTDIDLIATWQSADIDIEIGAVKRHINADLALRRKFRGAIYGVHILTILIAFWIDMQRLMTWPWVLTGLTVSMLAVQIYQMRRSRSNRAVAPDLTPRDALKAALRQNKINIRNAWIFSTVVPLSGIIGALIGGLLSHLIINADRIKASVGSGVDIITLAVACSLIPLLLASHIIGRRIAKRKKAERAILRKRLTLLEAGV